MEEMPEDYPNSIPPRNSGQRRWIEGGMEMHLRLVQCTFCLTSSYLATLLCVNDQRKCDMSNSQYACGKKNKNIIKNLIAILNIDKH